MSGVNANNATEKYTKAVFLFKIIDFVTWPEEQKIKHEIRNVCIFGDKLFGRYFKEIVKMENKEKDISLKYIENINESDGCHIVYVGESEKYQTNKIIDYIKNKPLLSVSGIKRFAYKKGMIEISLHPRKRNLQININIESVKKSHLYVSSNLIELATEIYGIDDEEKSQ